MNAIAHFFEATYMTQVGGPIIFLIFISHFILAARKIPFNADGQEIAWAHARMLRHRNTWLWIVQVLTGMILLFLGAIHMWVVLNDLPIEAAKSATRVRSGGWLWFYFILLPVIVVHIGIGVYRIGVKWGFVTRENRKKVELYLFFRLMLIGVITLLMLASMAFAPHLPNN
jgi:fumarate reductase subunit C